MKSWVLAASLLAAVGAGAPRALAADLDYGPRARYSSPYDDPRYRDLYGPRTTERYSYEERKYWPPRNGYDDDGDFESRRYAENHRFGTYCLPRHEIRRKLRHEGWDDFHDFDLRPDVALLRARRFHGELYDLKVDRCTGAVVYARPVERFVPGPFAHGPRRWARPYF